MDSRLLAFSGLVLDGAFCVSRAYAEPAALGLLPALFAGVIGLLPIACHVADGILTRLEWKAP